MGSRQIATWPDHSPGLKAETDFMKLTRTQKFMQTAFLTMSRFSRGMTMGVRALVVDDSQKVLLVRHTYVNGWYFPGGAIDPGEHAFAAVERELSEEAGIGLTGPPQLLRVFQNAHASVRDHVVLFYCPDWTQKHAPDVPNREIAELGFFAQDDLPADISPGTTRRLEEWRSQVDVLPVW